MRLREYRLISQTVFFILSNLGFLFVTGLIYPFLYCYQCPTASASCPIGILEHAVTAPLLLIYFFGFIGLIGIVFGRLFCGWACPIGSLQDILRNCLRQPLVYSLASLVNIIGFFRKKKFNIGKLAAADKKLRALKYILLILTVIISYVTGLLAFTLVCPVGGLTATLPMLAIEGERYVLGEYFWYKIVFTLGLIVLVAAILRGFCKYICPFGALIAVFNRASILKLKFNAEKCTQCKACASICPMGIDPTSTVKKSISIPVIVITTSLLFWTSIWNIFMNSFTIILYLYIMLWLITIIAILAAVFFADILEISESTKNGYGRDTECIRCFKCVEACKEKAVQIGYTLQH